MTRRAIVEFVADRADFRCEYCKMDDSLQGASFHIEHFHPRSRRGSNDLDNLCYSCSRCNARKAKRIAIDDPLSGQPVPLFNPRRQRWADHFTWKGLRMIGKTPTGRAMIAYFGFNSERRLKIRAVEEYFGLHPPS